MPFGIIDLAPQPAYIKANENVHAIPRRKSGEFHVIYV